MTAHKIGGRWEFMCDSCCETFEPSHREFIEALAEMRALGWKSRNVDGEWQHLCEECAEKEKQK